MVEGWGVEEKCMQSFDVEPGRKQLLGRLRCRWKGNIKMDFMCVCVCVCV